MTRIKYHKDGKNYISEYLTCYDGKKLLVFIHYNIVYSYYTMSIVDIKGKEVENDKYSDISVAKRKARDLLINKYNVRLVNEVRQK